MNSYSLSIRDMILRTQFFCQLLKIKVPLWSTTMLYFRVVNYKPILALNEVHGTRRSSGRGHQLVHVLSGLLILEPKDLNRVGTHFRLPRRTLRNHHFGGSFGTRQRALNNIINCLKCVIEGRELRQFLIVAPIHPTARD